MAVRKPFRSNRALDAKEERPLDLQTSTSSTVWTNRTDRTETESGLDKAVATYLSLLSRLPHDTCSLYSPRLLFVLLSPLAAYSDLGRISIYYMYSIPLCLYSTTELPLTVLELNLLVRLGIISVCYSASLSSRCPTRSLRIPGSWSR